MEQITRDGEGYRYGNIYCNTVEEAYERFRRDYHEGLGRDASRRLDRIGMRTERIHGYGFVRGAAELDYAGDEFRGFKKVCYRILGLVGIHYCRILGEHDLPGLSEQQFDRWFEWAFTRGSGALRQVGKNDISGRTNKNRRRYR